MRLTLIIFALIFSFIIYGKEKIVAIGDIHGDFEAFKKALKIAGATDDSGKWIGGKMIVVQTGDFVDRGSSEPEIFEFIEKLKKEASLAGGQFVVLNGNHEIMNASGDFRFASDISVKKFKEKGIDRNKEFLPAGNIAKKLAENSLYAVFDKIIFVHGGIKAEHVKFGLEKINKESKDWLLGNSKKFPEFGKEMIWMRDYSDNPNKKKCEMMKEMLKVANAEKIVMGHTAHEEIKSVCGRKGYLIDVGISKHKNPKIEVLVFENDKVYVLPGKKAPKED